MTDTLTIVTVTIVNADGECASVSERFTEHDASLEAVIDSCTEAAAEEFSSDDNGFSQLYVRAIVNVNILPTPRIPSTVVTAELPEQTEGATTVTTTIS